MDIILDLHRSQGKSLYKCLADQLVECIAEGRLAAGQPLPPTRELSRALGISRYTVVRAYNELINRGQAEVLSTRGTFVRDPTSRSKAKATDVAPAAKLGQISDYSKRLIESQRVHATAGHQPQLNFGASPVRFLPIRKWQQLLLKHCSASSALLYQPDAFGRMELRRVIASYLHRTRGIKCSMEQVIIFSQTQNALNMLCRLLLNTGDRVAVEEPGFGGIKNTAIPQDAEICPIQIDEQGLTITGGLDRVEAVKLIYVTPAHHDPIGITLSMKRRNELLERAYAEQAWVVEDDFDSDFYYGAKPLPPLAALDKKGAVIYLSSFWKALYPLTCVGYAVVPHSLIALMNTAKAIAEPNAEALEHLALADFIEEGLLERHLRRVRKLYAKQRSSLLLALKQTFKSTIEIARYSAGMHQLIHLDLGINDDTIQQCAARAGLGLASTGDYYYQAGKQGEFLVDFTSVPAESAFLVIGNFYKALSSG